MAQADKWPPGSAEMAAKGKGESAPAPKLLAVTLPRPTSLAGTPVQHFAATKYTLLVNERTGDVEIHDARGNYLVVPKAQAILEYRE